MLAGGNRLLVRNTDVLVRLPDAVGQWAYASRQINKFKRHGSVLLKALESATWHQISITTRSRKYILLIYFTFYFSQKCRTNKKANKNPPRHKEKHQNRWVFIFFVFHLFNVLILTLRIAHLWWYISKNWGQWLSEFTF